MQSIRLNSDGSVFLVDETIKKATNPDAILALMGFTRLRTAGETPPRQIRVAISPTTIIGKCWRHQQPPHEACAIRIPSFTIKCHTAAHSSKSGMRTLAPLHRDRCQDGMHKVLTLEYEHFWFGSDFEGNLNIVAELKEEKRTRFAAVPLPNSYENGRLCPGRMPELPAQPILTRTTILFDAWQNNLCNQDLNFWQVSEFNWMFDSDGNWVKPKSWPNNNWVSTPFTEMILGGDAYDSL
jgi:hypothetical protein